MRKVKTQQSRRALLKKGSLGVAGTLGATSVAAAGASLLHETRASAAHANDIALNGVWEFKADAKTTIPLPINLLPEIKLVHGQIAFLASGILFATTDLDDLAPFRGPLIMGNWKVTATNQFALFAKRRLLSQTGVDAGLIEIQGIGTLDASGNSFTATFTLKSTSTDIHLPSFTVSYNVQGTPLTPATS